MNLLEFVIKYVSIDTPNWRNDNQLVIEPDFKPQISITTNYWVAEYLLKYERRFLKEGGLTEEEFWDRNETRLVMQEERPIHPIIAIQYYKIKMDTYYFDIIMLLLESKAERDILNEIWRF